MCMLSEARVSIYRRKKEIYVRCIFFFGINATKGKRKFITKVISFLTV